MQKVHLATCHLTRCCIIFLLDQQKTFYIPCITTTLLDVLLSNFLDCLLVNQDTIRMVIVRLTVDIRTRKKYQSNHIMMRALNGTSFMYKSPNAQQNNEGSKHFCELRNDTRAKIKLGSLAFYCYVGLVANLLTASKIIVVL